MRRKKSSNKIWSCSHKVFFADGSMLWKYSHRELRDYARSIGVRVGKTKEDTIYNLVRSGKATICASLGN